MPTKKIDIKSISSEFKGLTFEEVKRKYKIYFNKIYEENKKWMINVEDKLHLIIDKNDRIAIKNILEKLKKSDYSFNEFDTDNLAVFTRIIDKTLNVSNFINNFTIKNLKENKIIIYELFNKIKSSKKFQDLNSKVRLGGTLKTNIPYLFSAVKHCQSPILYPVYYKYWYTILGSILGKGSGYDDLTNFYRTFPEKNRLLNFCAYFGALGNAILFELKPFHSISNTNSSDYRKIYRLIPSKDYIAQVFDLNEKVEQNDIISNFTDFTKDCLIFGYFLTNNIINRFIASLLTKPFVILTGLSGSGKTKLAQAFAYWITESEKQYCILPVGADWTNREPLLGFPDALNKGYYIKPENSVVELLLEAEKEKNANKPFFLILDEMNLSHVERYFADFLSVMETSEEIYLHTTNNWKDDIPPSIKFPRNLFIIGTVNVDETTYMFSPKVLDRAHVIEFRVSDEEMKNFLNQPLKPDLESIKGLGKNMASDFILKSRTEISEFDDLSEIKTILLDFFKELKKIGAEFGYRSASEIYRFSGILKMLTKENRNEWSLDDIVDAAVIQKLLPKVHGSRSKLDPVLKTLAALCYKNKDDFDEKIKLENIDFNSREKIKYPLSLEKILRMRARVIQDGFTSFTEA